MSNRIRCLLTHPGHGPMINGNALKFVEATFSERQLRRVQKQPMPADAIAWPRWKRCSWMAKKLGPTWKLQVFREPRRTRAEASLFWRTAQGMGIAMPKRRKNVVKAKLNKKLNPNIWQGLAAEAAEAVNAAAADPLGRGHHFWIDELGRVARRNR